MSRHVRLSFMDPLVLSIRADEKDVTRRIPTIRLAPDQRLPADWEARAFADGGPDDGYLHVPVEWIDADGKVLDEGWNRVFPRWHPGDVMDVCEGLIPRMMMGLGGPWTYVQYRAEEVPVIGADGNLVAWPANWTRPPSTFCCPTWAIRTHRRILSVRPERLSAVTDAEAVREGVVRLGWEPTREGFIKGFRALHKLGADADPWVFRVAWAKGEVQS